MIFKRWRESLSLVLLSKKLTLEEERLVKHMYEPELAHGVTVPSHSISGLNSLRYLDVLAPEIMNSPSPR